MPGARRRWQWASEGYIPLINNVALTQRMVPTLQRVAGKENVIEAPRRTAAEDFSFYAQEIPGFLLPRRHDAAQHADDAGGNQSFAALPDRRRRAVQGLRYMLHVTFDYMSRAVAAGKKTN